MHKKEHKITGKNVGKAHPDSLYHAAIDLSFLVRRLINMLLLATVKLSLTVRRTSKFID
jgi:hypothetical protein